jgi:hypothetical protein
LMVAEPACSMSLNSSPATKENPHGQKNWGYLPPVPNQHYRLHVRR